MAIGENIEQIRRRVGWTQTQLGASINVHQARISQFERNEALPTIPQLLALADATGATLDEILRGEQPPPASLLTDDEQFLLRVFRTLDVDVDLAVRAIGAAANIPAGAKTSGPGVTLAIRDETESLKRKLAAIEAARVAEKSGTDKSSK